MHMVKYQSLMCPNGIVCQLDGHYPGSYHDASESVFLLLVPRFQLPLILVITTRSDKLFWVNVNIQERL